MINDRSDFHPHYSCTQEINEFYWFTAIRGLAIGLVGIFLPIYVFLYFNRSVEMAAIFYLVQFLGAGLLAPIMAKLVSRGGIKRTLMWSNPILGIYVLFLILAKYWGITAIILAIAFKIIYLTSFWIAHDIYFSKFSENGKRGKEMGNVNIISLIVNSMAPFAGGFGIVWFGFAPVFVVSVILLTVSSFPLFYSPEVREVFSLNWKGVYKKAFNRRNLRNTIIFMFRGMELGAGLLLLPIFVYIVIENLETIGWITSLSLFLLVGVSYYVGKENDHWGSKKVMSITSILHGISWVGIVFIKTPLHYFFYRTLLGLAGLANGISYGSLLYKRAYETGSGVDEYVTMYTVAHSLGRAMFFLLVAIGFYLGFQSFLFYFALAGVGAFATRFLK